jgi:patatin-like phospholipase/acyl hydrolase
MGKKLYILSVDGGGLKGLIAIRILQIIEEITKNPIRAKMNLMGGTSTGGLIVSAMAVKDVDNKPLYELSHIENSYLEVGQTIFQRGDFRLTGHETDDFNILLRNTFGNSRIADTLIPICVPTFDLNQDKLVFFRTRSALQDESRNSTLFDVCRATSAIPPVFPTYPMEYEHRMLNCVDAGYRIKNPSLAVLAEAWKHKAYYGYPDLEEKDIVLLSVSTGSMYGGKRDWSLDISEVLPDQRIAMDYMKRQGLTVDLPKISYMRVDLNLGSGSFSFMKLIEIGNRLETLALDKAFHSDVLKLLEKE